MPLHLTRWTAFDDFVGHRRRYEPERLLPQLAGHALWLTRHRERAMQLYNRVLMPIALRFQKPFALAPGMIRTEDVDEILLVCRKAAMAGR